MKKLLYILLFSFGLQANAMYMLLPMDMKQKNHLKAYGIAYWVLNHDITIDWLLNYRGGSFMFKYNKVFEDECVIRGVSYDVIADIQSTRILETVTRPEVNMDVVKLEKLPKIAVYSPKTKLPWDDAVTLALTYAEIPYNVIFDKEVLQENVLPKYDWLHLHHEDFTGQYGKFYRSYRNDEWYIQQVKEFEQMASQLGYEKVSQMKLAVVHRIRDFVLGGGYLFAMCSATDTYDIALTAEGVDICDYMYDGDPPDNNVQSKLDFSKSFAFTDFKLIMNPLQYEYSSIDNLPHERKLRNKEEDYFTLFDFSAKWDPVPTMLCQNHTSTVKGFMGQTTAYKKHLVKPEVLIMGECKAANEVRYIHGEIGSGMWTFYGGHDPEDYQHLVGEPPTDLNLHPNSPGYRLILNNVLFPAARKKKQKT